MNAQADGSTASVQISESAARTESPSHPAHNLTSPTTIGRNRKMTNVKVNMRKYAVVAAFLSSLPLSAAAQEACTTYAVKAGDSLGSIANAAYGSFDYQMIFNANREILAGDPNNLKEGLQLVLPCADGRLNADTELNSVSKAETEKQAAIAAKSNVYEPPLKFITGDGWAPFTSKGLNGGGILTRIATTAIQRGGNNRQFTVSWVDDWQSHLDALLPSGAYDISIAWEQHDCDNLDMLSPEMVKRCTDFDYTLPVYEVAEGFFSLPDNKYAAVKVPEEYKGAKLCRPDAWGTADLEKSGLVAPLIELVQPKTPKECAQMVLDGKVDIFTIELETALGAFKELSASEKVLQNPNIVNMASYSLVTSKNNPRGRVYIAMLNKGIAEMRESGEWYDIVASGLDEYNKASK